MGGTKMNRLLYGEPHPCEMVATMIEKEVTCDICNGEGGHYLDLETNKCVSREEYLMYKDEREYELMPCEECNGTGLLTIYEEIPNYWED
jgi:RecJ-like exonuclease